VNAGDDVGASSARWRSIYLSNQLLSNLATGTAPFSIASTTSVANLNVDLLDDQHGSYYLDSANFTGTNWTDLTDGGATTLHKHDHGGLDGLGDDDHSIYALLAGRSGGQVLTGGTASGDDLELESTSNATKGHIRSRSNFIIGNDAAGIDYTLTFAGETNDGVVTWMEDEDYFSFSDDLFMATTESIYFRSTNNKIYSNATDELTITAPTMVNIGVDGDVVMGTSNLRKWYPASDAKIDFGDATHNINDLFITGGIIGLISTEDFSSPPTDAEIDAAFGTPATVGSGWFRFNDDNGAGTRSDLIWSDGTNWWYITGTKAV
jgi:hypothetical protein